MKPSDTPWELADRTVEQADRADREIRMSDFLLLAVVPYRALEVSGYPVNELAMAALVGLAVFRPARGGAKLHGLAMLLLVALLALMVGSGVANHVDWTRRVGHLLVTGGVIWAMTTGRISIRSAASGIASGLISVIVLAILRIGGDAYPGRLTGFLGDPNAGAYFITVLGVLAVSFVDQRRWVRLTIAVPIVAGLVLCYSRTGLLAGALAFVWITVGRRLGVVGGAVLATGLVWLVNNIPDDLVTFGPFSDRSGSDKLRERIIAQEYVQLSDMPWYGHGPGTGTVNIRGLTFFFHNSYLATRQEGGWVALLLVLALMAFAFLRLSRLSRAGDMTAAGAQAAILAAAVMAITLGEVLLDTPLAIAVAMALAHARTASSKEPPDG